MFPQFFLPDTTALHLDRVVVLDPVYLLFVRAVGQTAVCPLCGAIARRVHSRYVRSLHDLPLAGKIVRMQLQLRRFFCPTPHCRRVTFTERLGSVVKSYARSTVRFTEALQHIGLTAGGQAGARLACQLGLPTSPDTLLRRLRHLALPAFPIPRVLGVDDFALKKGQRYGTILVDLERHQPIDLLPDRDTETFRQWLTAHPGIEIISRDRAGNYAEAAHKAAPQATQVADRFHVAKNLGDAVVRVLQNHSARIQEILSAGQPREAHHADRPARVAAQLARYQQRRALYEQVTTLAAEGMPKAAIAEELDISVRRVRVFLKGPPYIIQHPPEATKLDPYRAYIREQFAVGGRTGTQVYADICAQGYPGGKSAVIDYLTALRQHSTNREPTPEPTVATALPQGDYRYSAYHLVWWFTLPPEKLRARQREKRAQLCQAIPDLAVAYSVAQSFHHLFADHDATAFDQWATQTEASGVPELIRFARGLRRDAAAICAAITLKWNNGPVEGEVNKVKLLKRSMFGRAGFALLRIRVLADEANTHRAIR